MPPPPPTVSDTVTGLVFLSTGGAPFGVDLFASASFFFSGSLWKYGFT